jgi:hypothetical protein
MAAGRRQNCKPDVKSLPSGHGTGPVPRPRKDPKETAMFARIAQTLRNLRLPGLAEIERAYLEAAVSRTDLERRQREVEGGMFRRSSFDL